MSEPDLSDAPRLAEYYDLLPTSTAAASEAMDVARTTIEGYRKRLQDNHGVELEYDRAENVWREVESDTTDDGTDDTADKDSLPTVTDPDTGGPTDDELPSAFISALRENGLTYAEMERRYGFSRDKAKRLIDRMQQAGWCIDFDTLDKHGTRRYYIPDERDKRYQIGDGDGTYRFALISDTHLGSKACHLADLHDFYDRMQNRGVELVLHGGDIGDGWEVHPNQINEVHPAATGWNRLEDYVVEHYPQRDGMETLFISGNHDHKLWKRSGVRFGEQLGNRRDDLHWLGDSMARLVFHPGTGLDMELIHPSGGQPYTLGYRAQTLYREQPAEIKPSMTAIAHLHGRLSAAAEGVEAWYTGCWKDLTTYGRRKGHAAEIGGWDIELTVTDGKLDEWTQTWVNYEAEDAAETAAQLQDVQELVSGDVSADASDATPMFSDQ